MINRVFLLWQSYTTKELLLLGSLTKVEEKGYEFKYEKDAVRAQKLGCFLPFEYTEDKLYFSSLPPFFAQRMLTSHYNSTKFGINYDPNNELAALTYKNSIKNSDNFSIISEDLYQSINSKETIGAESNQMIRRKK